MNKLQYMDFQSTPYMKRNRLPEHPVYETESTSRAPCKRNGIDFQSTLYTKRNRLLEHPVYETESTSRAPCIRNGIDIQSTLYTKRNRLPEHPVYETESTSRALCIRNGIDYQSTLYTKRNRLPEHPVYETDCNLLPGILVGSIAQSVQRLATGWTVRESKPGAGEIFRTIPDRPWGTPSLLYNGYRG